MVFSSLLFVFVFLFFSMLIYLLVPARLKNGVLLVSSLIFYAWGGIRYLFLLLSEVLISWLCALQIARHPKPSVRRMWMVTEAVLLLGLLGIFKYLGFVLTSFQGFFGVPDSVPQIVLPIGISFYTFQLLSYVIDVYRQETAPQTSFWKLLLYASLFHQCIAGPIVRYKTIADEIDQRSVTLNDIYDGVRRFCIGLAKKAVLANGCASICDTLLVSGSIAGQPLSAYWLGMLAYMLQIYLDFSAYSDMAIGMGRMVGFHYLENFDYPYTAVSVQDFWRRWHISLSSFFRDYVYIPLGGSRQGVWIYVRNMITVWFLTGLWHGASWNYILWGLYYLVFLLLERFVIRQRIPGLLNRLYTLSVVFFGWTIFKFEDMHDLGAALAGLSGFGASSLNSPAVTTVFVSNIFLLIVSIIACTSLSVLLRNLAANLARSSRPTWYLYCAAEALVPAALSVISILCLIGSAYNPFIYFQF